MFERWPSFKKGINKQWGEKGDAFCLKHGEKPYRLFFYNEDQLSNKRTFMKMCTCLELRWLSECFIPSKFLLFFQ